jgi:4-diphosphocytidyl-2-C-methyl-D-erythritol kinase
MMPRASAPGKLNLLFRVGGNRSDGFHEVLSIYQAVNIREEVSVQHSKFAELSVSGSIVREQLDQVPRDASNLVFRAAAALASAFPGEGREPSRLAFEIDKRIPLLGGMAGGSADAAAALIAVAKLWNIDLPGEQLMKIATTLGSDVPFALLGATALGQGRGELLTELESHEFNWVLVFSSDGLSTPEVFRALDKRRSGWTDDQLAARAKLSPDELQQIKSILIKGDAKALADLLENDLEPIACELLPQLSETLRLGTTLGALHSQVSGSGPTVFLLAESAAHAESLCAELTLRGHVAIPAVGNAVGARLE